MRDDIIEACALALMNEHLQGQGHDAGQDFISETARQIWHKKARAVLAAFKEATAEPTPGMVEAGEASANEALIYSFTTRREIAIAAHQAMQEQLWEELGI